MIRPGIIAIIITWIAVLATGGRLARSPEMMPSQDRDVLDLLVGEARTVLSKQMFERADSYFHGGIEISYCTHGLASSPTDSDHDEAFHDHMHSDHEDETDGHDHDHDYGHEDDHHDHDHAEDAPSDWLSRINQRRMPSGHRHLAGDAEKELVPWLWAAVRADAKNVLAAQVAAYWLAKRLDRKDEAVQLLREAIHQNPANADLEYMLGSMLFTDFGEPEAAQEAFLKARAKWEASRIHADAGKADDEQPDPLVYYNILRLLGQLQENAGNSEAAVDWYRQAIPYAKNPHMLEGRIRQLQE